MIPVFQTHFDELGTGPGNCMQAVAASYLELPLDRVPNFILEPGDPWRAFENFFAQHGVYLRQRPRGDVPPGLYLATGRSLQGHEHIVIMQAGRIVHDPNPHGKGMESIDAVIWPVRMS